MKHGSTALSINPTAGTDFTPVIYRTLAVNKASFIFSEDTGPVQHQIILTADPSTAATTTKTGSPVPERPGVTSGKLLFPYTGSDALVRVGSIELRVAVNETVINEAELKAAIYLALQAYGSSGFYSAVHRRTLTIG